VNIPIFLFLIFLTAVGPILAWRSTSWGSIQRNLTLPTVAFVISIIAMVAGGMHPLSDTSRAYSLIAVSLSVFAFVAITGEFWRGTRVVATQTGNNYLSALILLTRRNTRRYGGYLVHYGVLVCCVGFSGATFDQGLEQDMGFRDEMNIGRYKLVCQKYTQDDNANYFTESAILDVYENGKKINTVYPERRSYKASGGQPSTMVANLSTMREDLYIVYTGRNPENDKPIIKAHVKPLVKWIWVGAHILVIGTLIALVPPIKPGKAAVVALPQSDTSKEEEKKETPDEIAAREALA